MSIAESIPSDESTPPSYTVATLPSGKTGWCNQWSVVTDCFGNRRIDPGAAIFEHPQMEAPLFVSCERGREIHIEWDFTRYPLGQYDNPPASWPTVRVRGKGMNHIEPTPEEPTDIVVPDEESAP